MKNYEKKIGLVGLAILLLFSNVAAQLMLHDEKELSVNTALPPVALVDVEPGMNNDLSFSVSPTIDSGDSPQIIQSNSEQLWLNYSSVIVNDTRFIDAQLIGGQLPDGIQLVVQASQYSGGGAGQLGQPTGEIILSTSAKAIVSDIGNCFTGDGINNGHLLTFSIVVDDLGILEATNQAVYTILYTIRD